MKHLLQRKTLFYWALLVCQTTVLSCNPLAGEGDLARAGTEKLALAKSGTAKTEVTAVSWNVQTFFDATDTGTEYEDFTGVKSKWTETKYAERLKRLCSFIEETDADIYCLMEIENEGVVRDITNHLHQKLSGKSRYPYAAFARDAGSSIGCAVLSRYPLESLTVHTARFTAALPAKQFAGHEAGDPLSPPQLRPLMEVRLHPCEGCAPLALFVNHWKSKSSGARESEVWRNAQEAVLAERIELALAEGCGILAVGDLNRELNEFRFTKDGHGVALRKLYGGTVRVESPWFGSTEEGSYYYKDDWNRIDHIFAAGPLSVTSFAVLRTGSLTTGSGHPNGYNVWSGEGMSDHLPLFCTVAFSGDGQ